MVNEATNQPYPKVNSIEWHKKCLDNSEAYEQKIRTQVIELSKKLETTHKDNHFYREQILKAIEEKKDSFDKKKYLVRRVNLATFGVLH